MAPDIPSEKRALRAEIRARRRAMTVTERDSARAAITGHLIRLIDEQHVNSLAAYLSTPDEPDTRRFLAAALVRGARVLLPVSRSDGLLDWAPHEGGDEDVDLLGMPTPTSALLGPIAVNDVDLILVPAASVDRTGMRMGWGMGYFDKTLGSMEKCPPVYAVIFDRELVDSVPSEVHDQPVDGVVTESGITVFAKDR